MDNKGIVKIYEKKNVFLFVLSTMQFEDWKLKYNSFVFLFLQTNERRLKKGNSVINKSFKIVMMNISTISRTCTAHVRQIIETTIYSDNNPNYDLGQTKNVAGLHLSMPMGFLLAPLFMHT